MTTTSKRYTVTQGISPRPGAPWFAAEVKPNGSLRRVCSPALPKRVHRPAAEKDLLIWLGQKVHTAGYKAQRVYGEAYDRLRAELKERTTDGTSSS